MTQAARVVDYLWSVAPNGATNGELARRLGIRSHWTVYMLTQQLMYQGRIPWLVIRNNLGVPCRRGVRHNAWYWTCMYECHNTGSLL